jgi:hypothetical protein
MFDYAALAAEALEDRNLEAPVMPAKSTARRYTFRPTKRVFSALRFAEPRFATQRHAMTALVRSGIKAGLDDLEPLEKEETSDAIMVLVDVEDLDFLKTWAGAQRWKVSDVVRALLVREALNYR